VDPSVDVAQRSQLEVDHATGGIAVNQQLEASSNIFVAGGVASYFDAALGRRRVEMFDHSINSGTCKTPDAGGYRRKRDHVAKRKKRCDT
jgi:programmed cell death 8 (apoptosis-inducing factor)